MITVKQIYDCLNSFAPVERKMDFDNVGHLVGRENNSVSTVLLSLDITDNVIEEGIKLGAELIVSHHPLFFSLKSVTDSELVGRKIVSLLENHMSAVCMHTNLDAADEGVNAQLAKVLGLQNPVILTEEGRDSMGTPYCCGRIGTLKQAITMETFLQNIKTSLHTGGLRYVDSGKPVYKVAVVGGSGGSYLDAAYRAGCDTLITADVKYNPFLDAGELGMNLIDADHFCTENVVIPVLFRVLSEKFPELKLFVSSHGQVIRFI